jgi:uncharacterized protein (UPF0548 family)
VDAFNLSAMVSTMSSWPAATDMMRSQAVGHDRRMPLTVMAGGLADRLRSLELSYGEAGRTAGVLPPGYHHLHRSVVIGSGAEMFARAATALFSWEVQLRAGLRVSSSSAMAESGAVVLLGLGAGPFQVGAPCRVVYVADGPGRRGFAYGTLPGHPECGEEAFIIEHHEDDAVTFAITAFSRPAILLARAAGPLGRVVQHRITARYLRALAG